MDRVHPGTPFHRAMTPPPYLASFDHDAPPWHEPIVSRRAALRRYERERAQGIREIDPELELRSARKRAKADPPA